jgi:hypothetical protein
MKRFKNYLFFILWLSLFGCAGAPVKMTNVNEGHWRARALIKDLEQSKSYIVNLNINAVRDQRVRMDVTSTLGTGVASMLVDQKDVRYVLLDSKRFYYGNSQPDVMRPILSIPFDPRWLHNILFDETLPEKSWTCVRDGSGLLKECKDSILNLKISWSNRKGEKKTILIEHPKATVQINVQSFKPKVEDRKNLFQLEAPAGYQKLRVR